MKKVFPFLLLIFFISKIPALTGCANIVPPQGGPRDSIPPSLIKANPVDSARNFTGNRLTFSFDEFIDIQNVQENLLVSPIPKTSPSVDFRLNTLTVRLKDSLEPNTTYSLNFGNAIKDYNEGNILKGFTYTFSTGPYIDSLELSGNVVLAETGKIDTTLIVMLHTNANDSSVVKEKPRYIVRLDSKGNFIFRNLPPKTFYLYALKDEGGTNRYFNDKQLFAFAGKPVTLQAKKEDLTLYAYAGRQAAQVPGSISNPGNRNKPVGVTAEKRLRYQTSVTNSQQDLLGNFIITFEQPLRSFDSSKIRLYTDSTFIHDTAHQFEKDSSNRKIQLIHTWKENTAYHIIIDKDFAEDTAGKKLLKTDTISFKTKKLSDYGTLKIQFRNLDISKNPVLLFVTNETIVKSFPLSSTSFSQQLFMPGDYELRILYDENKNGVWDPGEFFGKHKQPEIVRPVERRITVKPNWQNEFEIAL